MGRGAGALPQAPPGAVRPWTRTSASAGRGVDELRDAQFIEQPGSRPATTLPAKAVTLQVQRATCALRRCRMEGAERARGPAAPSKGRRPRGGRFAAPQVGDSRAGFSSCGAAFQVRVSADCLLRHRSAEDAPEERPFTTPKVGGRADGDRVVARQEAIRGEGSRSCVDAGPSAGTRTRRAGATPQRNASRMKSKLRDCRE